MTKQFKIQQLEFNWNDAPRTRRLSSSRFFLKGPVDWRWLSIAGCLRGRVLHVGIVLWLLSGMLKSPTVDLKARFLRDMGIDRHTAYRGTKALEGAGLVRVERRRGRAPVVTIVSQGDSGPDRESSGQQDA